MLPDLAAPMGHLLAILSCALVAFAPAGEAAPAPAVAVDRGFETLVIHADGVDAAGLRERLELRLVGRAVTVYTDGTRADPGIAVLQVRTVGEELALSLVLPDGGAYFRTIKVGPGQPERIVATTVANLIAAIEANQVEPDREGVSTQEMLTNPSEATEPALQRPKAQAPAEPETVDEPAPTEPEPEPEPEPPPENPQPPSPSRAFEIGIAAGPGLGLGFPRVPTLRGFGADGALSLVLRSGALVRVGVRGLGQRASEYRLSRLRVSVGAGYDVRARAFEMPVLGAVSVEPWWVANGEPRGPAGAPVPLLGGHVRVEPSYRIDTKRDRVALRLGLALELAGSAELRDGVVAPTVRRTDGGPVLFRLGGAEASAGFVFEVRVRASP